MRISAHLRSDYRFTYDYVDTSDPDCPQTIKASSRVVTDMPTVRPARFRVTRVAGGPGYAFLKRGGGPQRADRAIDMRADMTRSTEGGRRRRAPAISRIRRCAAASAAGPWTAARLMGRGQFLVSPEVPVFPSIQQVMEDDEWRQGGCGYDSTQADEINITIFPRYLSW